MTWHIQLRSGCCGNVTRDRLDVQVGTTGGGRCGTFTAWYSPTYLSPRLQVITRCTLSAKADSMHSESWVSQVCCLCYLTAVQHCTLLGRTLLGTREPWTHGHELSVMSVEQ
jgi:hypothetical protein